MLNKQEIREKLNKKYNYSLWKEIISEIFPNKEFFTTSLNKPLNESETKTAKSIKQFGQISLTDNRKIALFEVELKSNKDVNRNRVELRGLISKDLLSGVKDGALVVYYQAEKPQYRFTFIAKQTKITETGDFEESETDTKRFTYVLGETETCNTPADRFFKLSEIKEKKLSDIEEAFSVEKVSKEFFEEYRKLFIKFNEYSYENFKYLPPFNNKSMEDKGKFIRDFNKKLLGRIVFLYFLQKKRWIGSPIDQEEFNEGDVKFLSNWFEKYSKENKNFYVEFLEPLFYETLNKPRNNNKFDLTNSKVPFLNGGLFELEKDEKIGIFYYPNELFKNLFEFFNKYNFTINEDSVEEQEVAIDPEMLGHIFENLLEDNKEKGAFYTPKVIVKYMCQEALIKYLKNHLGDKSEIDELIKLGKKGEDSSKNFIFQKAKEIEKLLDNIKIFDPAIGSGAFPMGLLHEILNIKIALNWTLNIAEAKKKIIKNSIYGVDIEKGAIDIAMLRFWLSLTVDEEKPLPLPNLEFNFICANSLISLKEKKAIRDSKQLTLDEDSFLIDKLKDLRNKHFDVFGESKINIENEFEEIQKQIFKKAVFSKQFDSKMLDLSDWKPFSGESCSWFNSDWMFGIDKFDIVIANPPYVFARDSEKKGMSDAQKKYFYDSYELAKYQINLYPLFIEMATKNLKDNGVLCFITPNNWMTINTNKDLRKFILNKSDITIVNFYAKVFENANVDSSIIVFQNSDKNKSINLYEYDKSFKLIKKAETSTFLTKKDYLINIEALKNSSYSDLIDLIEKDKLLLKAISDVKAGLQAYELGKGNPIQTKEMKDSRVYHSSKKIDDTYIKYLDGKDVCRYEIKWSGEYLKYGKNLASPRNDFNLFSTRRILVRQIPSKPPYSINACFTEEEILNDRNSMNIINIKFAPKFILSILNSRLMTFWFIHKFGKLQRGIFPQFKINELETFPIPDVSKRLDIQESFINLVDYIMYLKKNPEKQIDEYVPNSHLIETFDEVLDGCVFELYFEDEMKNKDINIIDFVKNEIKPINNLEDKDIISIIQQSYNYFRDSYSEVRNRIMLFSTRSEHILLQIQKGLL